MPEPEIARRCPQCGESIRELAFFCPQCGNPLPRQRAAQSTSKDTGSIEGSEPQSPPVSMSDTVLIERPEQTPKTPANSRSMSDTMAINPPQETPQTATGSRVRGTVGAQLQRATTLARDVEGDVIHRVQKVREISSVVLDEAGDDPGLRFVLVAAIVFLLFLVIVLLNKLIT